MLRRRARRALTFAAIPPPPFEALQLGHMRITLHGLLILVPALIAVAWTVRRWKARGGSAELVVDVAVWALLGGIAGARFYHVATSWSELPDAWWGPFAVWRGGLASWGGLLGGTLAGVAVLRRRGVPVRQFMDAAAPAVLLAYALGRLGNYTSQELFGPPTGLPWGLEVEPDFRPDGYEEYATFQPTFLYELLWEVGVVFVLLAVERRVRVRPPGLFLLFLAGYGLGRMFGELFFRIDPAITIGGLRLNFYVATVLVLVSGALLARTQSGARSPDTQTVFNACSHWSGQSIVDARNSPEPLVRRRQT